MSRSLSSAARPLLQRSSLGYGRSRLPVATASCQRLLSTSTLASTMMTTTKTLQTRSPASQRPQCTAATINRSMCQRQQQRRWKSGNSVEEAKSRYRTGPFSWKAGLLFVVTSGGLVWYFEYEKERMHRRRVAEATKGVGRPKVGGDFDLLDQDGKPFSSADMLGRYSLVSCIYFCSSVVIGLIGCGFTFSCY